MAAKIVDVAEQLMLENGYSDTSIEAVANAAGVAKRTLYSRFPNKSDLFAAVAQRRREQFFGPLQKISTEDGSLEERLLQIGKYMLDWGLKNDTIAMRRLITAELARFPEVSAAVHTESRGRTLDFLAAIFDSENTKGGLRIADSYFAAMQFLEMIMAPANLEAHYGFGRVSGNKRRDYVVSVVNLFLYGCGGRDGSSDRAGKRPKKKS